MLIGLALGLIAIVGIFLYWQLVVAEGVYLGQGMVTYLYDITATRYDQIKAYQPDMESLFLGQPLAEMLADREHPAILDVGTGTGRLPLALFAQSTFAGDIVGVDASLPMLEQAQSKLSPLAGSRYFAIWLNAAILPFPDGMFDAVTCLEMTEFTADPLEQLREGVRVLKPGGVFLTSRRRGTDAKLMPGKTFPAEDFREILVSLSLRDVRIQPWQVDYDIVWAQKSGVLIGQPVSIGEHLQCRTCLKPALNWQPAKVVCTNCGAEYNFEHRILSMNETKRRAK